MQLSWSSTGRSHRNSHQATQNSVLRTTKSPSLALKGFVPLLALPLTLIARAGSSSQPRPLTVRAVSAREPRKPLWITACCCMCFQKSTEHQKSPRGPGPVTYDPDLLLPSFPKGPGNLRVPWLQGKPMNCSSLKPTSCCSTFPFHPAPEAPRGVASSFACQFRDKPPLLRLPREKNLIVAERECSIPN